MKIVTSAIIFLSLFFLTGCEELISEVEIDQPKAKIVVVGFISPDLPVNSIKVYESRPLYTPAEENYGSYPVISDASVVIISDSDSAIMTYDSEYEEYRISRDVFQILKNETYSIRVSTPSGYFATSSCTVPSSEPPLLELASIDTLQIIEDWVPEYSIYEMRAKIHFKDTEGKGQYYRVEVGQINWTEGEIIPYTSEIGIAGKDNLASDINFDGETYHLTTNDFYARREEKFRLHFTLSLTDKNYYNYHRGITNFDNGNPFSEPTTIYSNIEGGLGVFAAYVQKDFIYEISWR